jgi:hypothetical protein
MAERTPRRAPWPASAVGAVAVLSVLVTLLAFMNLVGLQIGEDGHYNPTAGGNVADWLGAIGTLIALPAALMFGVRQLRAEAHSIQLTRQQLEHDLAEQEERRNVALARLRSSLRLRVDATNIVDAGDLATADERTAAARWCDEYTQRGWVVDPATSTWRQGAQQRSNAELLTAEASPLVPEPWFVALDCHNAGDGTIVVQRWTVLNNGLTTDVDGPAELGPGEHLRRRLGSDVGLSPTYPTTSQATSHAAATTVIVEAIDTAGRRVRIVHPPPE